MDKKNNSTFLNSGSYELDANKNMRRHIKYGQGMYFTPAHFHNFAELVFVISGKIKATVNGESKIITRGDTVVVNPFDVHSYEDLVESRSYVFMLEKLYTDRVFDLYKKAINTFDYHEPLTEEKEQILKFIEEFYTNYNKLNAISLEGYIGIIIGMLIDRHKLKDIQVKHSDFIIKLLIYVEENLTEPLTIEGLAFKFGYTKNYLSTLFCRGIGMNFREYLNMRRIELVEREKQRAKDDSLTRLVMRCGFGSLNTYYRAIKKFRDER